jgi:hypothetical protein
VPRDSAAEQGWSKPCLTRQAPSTCASPTRKSATALPPRKRPTGKDLFRRALRGRHPEGWYRRELRDYLPDHPGKKRNMVHRAIAARTHIESGSRGESSAALAKCVAALSNWPVSLHANHKKVRSELLRIQCYGVLECRNSFFRMTREI